MMITNSIPIIGEIVSTLFDVLRTLVSDISISLFTHTSTCHMDQKKKRENMREQSKSSISLV